MLAQACQGKHCPCWVQFLPSFLHVSVDRILGGVLWTSSLFFWIVSDSFLRHFEHEKKHGFLIVLAQHGGHSCQLCFRLCLVCFGLLQHCSGNAMINSRLDFYEWKCTYNYWLSTKGGFPNACVGGLVIKLWAWRSKVWEANHARVWDVHN